jgi:hypothetical protein
MKTILLEEIRDYTSLGNLKVDRVGAIVHNVKIIGFQSANDREYTPEALRQAIPMYEGVNVNIDHPDGGPDEQRSAWDRIGFLKNVKFVEGKGLYGDLHLLPSHPFTERILEAAEKMPQIYGLSHNAKGEGFEDKKTKKFVVNKVAEVRHVDLVADPATTHSLAESKEAEVPAEQEAEEGAYTRVGYKSRKRGVGAKRGYTKTKSKLYVSHESQESDGEKSKSSDGEYDKLHARIIDVLKHDGVPDHQKADQIVSLVTNKSSKKEEGRDMAKDETKISKDDDTEEAVSRDDDKDIRTDEPSDSDTEESEGSEECPKCGRKMESCCGEEKDEEDAEESEDGKADEKDDEEEPVSKKKMEKKKMKEKYSSKESKDSRKAIDDVKELCESHKLTADDSLIKDLAAVPVSVAEGLIKRLANAERLLKPKSAVKAKEAQKSEIDMLEGKQLFSWLRN